MKKTLLICGLVVMLSASDKVEVKLPVDKTTVVSKEMAKAASDYRKCTSCHGFLGEKNALGKSKPINGLTEKETFTALVNYQKGTMNKYGMGALMKSQTAGLTEKDMEYLAKHISSFTKK